MSVNINEIDASATIESAIGLGNKSNGSSPQPVAGAEAKRTASKMQRRGRTIRRDCIPRSAITRNCLFKVLDDWPLGQKIGPQDGHDRINIVLRNILPSIRNHHSNPKARIDILPNQFAQPVNTKKIRVGATVVRKPELNGFTTGPLAVGVAQHPF